MINWWINKSADWQAHLTERASGKIQAIFDRTPEWSHAYLLLVYGIAQPLLPAALVVTSQAPIWQGIAIWRAMGWTILSLDKRLNRTHSHSDRTHLAYNFGGVIPGRRRPMGQSPLSDNLRRSSGGCGCMGLDGTTPLPRPRVSICADLGHFNHALVHSMVPAARVSYPMAGR
jgi:hypothetical protein